MTPADAIARAVGGYEGTDVVPQVDYLAADFVLEALDEAGFKVVPKHPPVTHQLNHIGPVWAPYYSQSVLPHSIARMRPLERIVP